MSRSFRRTAFLAASLWLGARRPSEAALASPLPPSRGTASSAAAAAANTFEAFFSGKTMRVDFFHSGTASEEHVAIDRIVADGPWPGSRSRLLDDSNLGKYFFEVVDRTTNRTIYSRGFASVFGEWETTGEAKELFGTFHESLRFPWPRKPVQVTLKKRDRMNLFREVWTTSIDPGARSVTNEELAPIGQAWTLFENGPPFEKVDLVILGDGYSREELEKFHRDVKRHVDTLFSEEPFKSRKGDFSVRAIDLPSAKSGVSRPHQSVFRRTPLSAHYGSFDSERYVLTFDDRTLRDVASAVPYDFLVVLVNERTYGGGGIFGCQATASADSAFSPYIFVHEFGHHFAGLGDEYYTSDVAYETGASEHPEPWEPNVTAHPGRGELKWADLVDKATDLPTPWEKEKFEKFSHEAQAKRRKLRAEGAPEEEIEKLFREEQAFESELLGKMRFSRTVGAFEGASYEPKGLYRPAADCIMFTRDPVGFCPVCRRAIERAVDMYGRP